MDLDSLRVGKLLTTVLLIYESLPRLKCNNLERNMNSDHFGGEVARVVHVNRRLRLCRGGFLSDLVS